MVTDGGNSAKWTGANRIDIALHWLYRACLMEDEATLKTTLENEDLFLVGWLCEHCASGR